MGACIALSAAMMLTSVGGMLPSDWGIETVYADETQTTTKTFTAEQLEVIWGNAKSKLEDSKWKLSFENQYDQVKWKVPKAIALSDVKSVTFHVADQKGSVTLKVYNGGDDAEAANTQYGLTGSEEYTMEPSGEGSVDAIGLMTTDETGSGSEVSLISVTFELKEGSGSPITYGDNIIKDGDFASSEAAASWNASVGKSTITVATEENEIGDSDLKTYGVINRDPATATSGDCFSQDITDAVELGEEYQYSFWAKLSDVYKDAPEEQSETLNRSHIIGKSQGLMEVLNTVARIARTNASVLITGESGTGKELIAEAIHINSQRVKEPFVKVNLGGISQSLFESEMFGHKKGAFTDATTDRVGRFELANKGTIFLDEIGNLSYEVQIQLLRALQERKIRPVGSTQEISVDIRLVSATNENLEQGIEKGTFREDLYHRINEFTLRMPDLKERKEDILLFANFFLDQANKELDKHLIGFDAKASQALLNYHWPGNLRQMKNIVKRATLLAQNSFITLLELGTELLETPASSSTSIALRNEETEKEHILEALRQTGNNKSKAAQLLNIDRKTLYNKLKLYNIDL